jgi:hypothetical protein
MNFAGTKRLVCRQPLPSSLAFWSAVTESAKSPLLALAMLKAPKPRRHSATESGDSADSVAAVQKLARVSVPAHAAALPAMGEAFLDYLVAGIVY